MNKFSKYRTVMIMLTCMIIVLIPFALTLRSDPVQSYINFFINGAHGSLEAIYSWSAGNYGQNTGGSIWTLFPYGLIYSLFTNVLSLHSGITQFIVCGLLFGGAYLAYIKLVPLLIEQHPLRPAAIRISGLFYLFNPYTLEEFGESYLQVIPYLLLPLQILLLVRAFQTRKLVKYGLLLALVNALCFGVNLIFAVISFLVIVVVAYLKARIEWKVSKKRIVVFLAGVYGFSLLLCSFWIVPQIYSSLTYSANTQSVLQSEQFYNSDSSFIHVLRGLGEWSFFSGQNNIPYNSFATAYKDNPLIVFAGFLIPLIAISAVFFYRPRSRQGRLPLFLIASLFILFIIIVGTYPGAPLAGVIGFAFKHVPFAEAFRNTYKFASVEMLIIGLLLALVITQLFQRTSNRFIKASFAGLLLLLIGANAFPFFTNQLYSKDIQITHIPSYWQQTASYINQRPNGGLNSVFMLPDQYFETFIWNGQMKSFARNLEDTLFKPATVHNTCKGCGQYLTDNFLTQVYGNLSEPGVFKLLGLTGNNTIVQRNDYDYSYYGVQSPQQIKALLGNNPQVTKNRSIGQLDLYNINASAVNPLIYSPTSLVATDDLSNFATIANQHSKSTGIVLSNTLAKGDQLTGNHSNYYQPVFTTSHTQANSNQATTTVQTPRADNYTLTKSNPTNNYRVSYTSSGGNYVLNLQRLGNTLSVNNKPIASDSSPVTTINLGSFGNQAVVVELQGHSLLLEPGGSNADLGDFTLSAADNSVRVYSTTKTGPNLAPNGNLSAGLWQPKVGDCQESTPNANISMSLLPGDAPGGNNALQLTAHQDAACTQTPKIADFKSGTYYFSFQAKRVAGSQPSFCAYNGRTCVTYSNVKANSNWATFQQTAYFDNTASNFILYLYAQKANYAVSQDQYANVQIYHLTDPLKTLYYTLPPAENTSLSVPLASGQQTFANNLTLGADNLIVNGDFASGAWQSTVQNCTGPTGTDVLGMQVVNDPAVGKALQLSTDGTSSACTSSAYVSSFAANTAYLAAFKYRILEGTSAQLCVWNGQTCIANKTFTSRDHNWHSASELAVSNQGGQPLSIYLYAPTGDGSIVRYSDVSMRQVDNNFINDYLLTNQTPQIISAAAITNLQEDNPTRYEATIKPTGLNMIVFSQSYHPDWSLYLVKHSPHGLLENALWSLGLFPHQTVASNQHVVMNGYANGWWINSSQLPSNYRDMGGNYQLVMSYSPQNLVFIGIIISGICLLGAAVYLARPLVRRRAQSKESTYRVRRH